MVADIQEIPDGYKRTEVGVIPEDWTTPQIQNISKLINGRGFKPYEWRTSGLPIIRIQNLNGSQDYNYFDGHYDKKIEVEDGQLLFAWSGSRGTSFGPHYWNGPLGLLNYHTWKVISFNEKVEPSYYFHALKGLTKEIEESAHGASALVHVQKWEIEARELPLPTRKEQTAIADALTDADEAIRRLEAVIAKKRDVKQATLHALLTPTRRLPGFSGEWGECYIGDLCDVYGGGTPSTNVKRYWSGNIPWCTPTDITALNGKKYIIDTKRKISDEGLQNSAATLIPENSIIFTSRATIGEMAINEKAISTNQGFQNLIPKPNETVDFIFYKLKLHKAEFLNASKGSTFLELGKNELRNIKLSIPLDRVEQSTIAKILSDMDAEIEGIETRLDKLRDIKQGMMQVLLTGKVRLI